MSEKFYDGDILIREATAKDMPAVVDMIKELAEYEKMPDGPKLTVKDLQCDGFERQPPAFKCKVAESVVTGVVVGYALYFPTYSSWEGRALMLEDLYVRNEFRRRGVGQRLFHNIAVEAVTMGCYRLDFHVLSWNEARSFYEAFGAQNLTEKEKWCCYRLSGEALASFSSKTNFHSA